VVVPVEVPEELQAATTAEVRSTSAAYRSALVWLPLMMNPFN